MRPRSLIPAAVVALAAFGGWLLLGPSSRLVADGLSAARPAAKSTPLVLSPAALAATRGSRAQRDLARVADTAARELAGAGGASAVSFDAGTGLWDRVKTPPWAPPRWQIPMWWQSGLAFRSLMRYLTRAHDTQATYQQLIDDVYRLNISKPGTLEPLNFENEFMDDTAWWGLAWLDASRYELSVRHDRSTADRYLRLAERDATYIYRAPKTCGAQGIEFQTGYAPNTITNTEFISLAAQLAQVREATGPLHDARLARRWLVEARHILTWLEGSGLVDMAAGTVFNTYDRRCRPSGGAMTNTEGEMADALTQVGTATHDPVYYKQARIFINRILDPRNGMLASAVLQEPCEGAPGRCARHSYNITVFKGLVVDAVADWSQATASTAYDAFLLTQARAVVANSTGMPSSASCQTPATCQLSMYWARPVPVRRRPLPTTPGSQEAGLSALTDGLGVTLPPGF